MLSQIFKRSKKTALILVIFALLFSLNLSFLEAMACEQAFGLCFAEHMWMPDYATVYCVLGYFFCKKYMRR